ncbi:hypothetical protein [Roseobacter sinensis]|uniref:Uncharacterized protein n=1 Tax=Roseobacter sinensis TaxID=2931391 RepID=A0ABT3BIP0_9RHOB|nr:hypothetical protein [Roseobacter sp. WL0113]MCV3273438.1 hypothetical protein [Roseobacter sp. WL0113]
MGNDTLVVAQISNRTGQQNTSTFFVRGQQFGFGGNRIGEEALFLFPDSIDTRTFDIIGLERNLVAILADQDQAIDRDVPVVGVFDISAGGRASFVRGRSEAVAGTGVRHFDFALTKRGTDGWMAHSIGRRGVSVLFSWDTLRQASDEGDPEVIQGVGFRRGQDDDLQSTMLAEGNILLPHDRKGDEDDEVRFEARIISPGGVTIKRVSLGIEPFRNDDDAIEALKGGGFVVACTRVRRPRQRRRLPSLRSRWDRIGIMRERGLYRP